MTGRSTCPDAEALAALIDGAPLPGTRDDLVSHLARCAECSATVAAAIRHQEVDAAPARAPQHWRRSRPALVGGVLALAALAAVVTLWLRPWRPPAPPESPALAWMENGRWNAPGRRLGFAPGRPAESAVWLGLHLGALDRACREAGEAAPMVRPRLLESLSGSGFDGWHAALARGPACAPGRSWPPLDPDLSGWLDLGRRLERLRIAAEEGALPVIDREARDLEPLLHRLELSPPGRQALEEVAAAARRAEAAGTTAEMREAIGHALDVLLS